MKGSKETLKNNDSSSGNNIKKKIQTPTFT
jgi:hypothetical protein